MSDVNQARRQNLELIPDAPPTQPRGLPEAPTLQNVQKRTAPSGRHDVRLRLHTNGYAPLPAAGKAIYLEGWQAANITPEAIESWERGKHQSHRNTGLRTKHTPAFDIDIEEQAAAEAVEAMVRERFRGRGRLLVRIGMAPKRALLFRTESPFKKISRNLIAADSSTGQKFEFLGDGQQIVADGIHPDTERPYTWYGGTPWEVPASALPLITEAEARTLVDDAAALLIERFGYRHANPKSGTAGETKSALDWDTLEANILDGIELHDSLRDLAWLLVLTGTPRDVAVRLLRSLMNASAAPCDDRWQDRYDSIPRLVDSAIKKGARSDAASEFEPVEIGDDARRGGAPDSEPEPPLPFISAAAWHGLPIPQREWVLRDRIPMRNVTLLAGDGGVGKTILHLQAGTAIVLGREWLGIPTEPGPVAVVCCEDDADELHRRVALIANHNQVELSDLKDLHLLPLVDGHDTVLALPDSNGQIRPTKMYARLREAVCDIDPRLLTIDNLADVFGGNEINRVQVRQFITLLRNLAVAAGGATLLTAHPSLTGMASGSGTSGSTGWHNSARARMYMTQPKAEGGGGEPDRNLRVLKTMKSNYGPPSEEIKLRWCNGVWAPVHAVGVDRAAVAQEAETVFLALLDRFTREGRNVSHKPGPSYAPTLFAREAEAGPVGVTRKDFEAAMSRLFAGRKIRVENYGRPSRPYSRLTLVIASN